MKLAVFFPASLFSAWACSYGLVECLKRMGHEVTSVPIDPQGSEYSTPVGIDGIVISGPEHINQWVTGGASYTPRIPTVAWLHETVEREDYGKLDVDAIKRSADVIFCPAIQDEKYGFRYLSFGVDTEIFHSHGDSLGCARCDNNMAPVRKSVDAAFIGLLYPKRQAFLKELKSHGVNLVTGNVQVLELGGVNPRKTAELYAENIRKIKVFVNLPTLSQLAVTKIYEVLACGTPILTPQVSNMRNLKGLPVVAYEGAAECAHRIPLAAQRRWYGNTLQDDSDVPSWLASHMHENHRLELRCEVLVSALKELGAKSSHESLTAA
jgi:hypothetical protein